MHLTNWLDKFLKRRQKLEDKVTHLYQQYEQNNDPTTRLIADTHPNNVTGVHLFARVLLWTVLLLLIVAIVWASFTVVDEVTVAEGTVIPAKQEQKIQNLEGGIVKIILVHEGEMVQANQVLMQLDDTHFRLDYQQGQDKAYALQVKIALLSAILDHQPFVVTDAIKIRLPDLVNQEQQLYASQVKELQQLQTAYVSYKKEYDNAAPLVAQGAASDVEVLHLERQMRQGQQQINDFQAQRLQELNTAKADLLSQNAILANLQDRLARTTIRSPVKGIVKQINIKTIGGVAQPGMELVEVVPVEDTLLVEAKVKPKDIGFLRLGQPTIVEITAYDFLSHGGLAGRVEQIAADTTVNDKGESYYLIRVRTNKNYLGASKQPLYIIPGMVAKVDIITGHKSVLNYLLKPILKGTAEYRQQS